MALKDFLSVLSGDRLIGLDIGTSAIKACVTKERSDKSYELTHFRLGLLSDQRNEDLNLDDKDKTASLISNSIFDTLRPLNLNIKKLAVGGVGSSIIVKRVEFPKGSRKKNLEDCIDQLENHIHYSPEDVHLNFIHLKNISALDKEKDHFLITVISKDHIFEVSEIIYNLKYTFSVMDVESFALANSFKINYGSFDEQIVLVNIGASVTNVCVVEKGDLIYSQDTAIGGDKYTGEIAASLQVSQKEAESLKISYSKENQGPEMLQKTVSGVNELIFNEISGNLNFFQNQTKNSHLSKIYLTGGSSLNPGLTDKLSEILPCEPLDPFLKVKLPKSFSEDYINQIRPLSAISLGLSLRKDQDYD